MLPSELKGWLDREPFIPLRLHVSGGVHYDVFKPQFVMLGHSMILIGLRREIDSPYFDEPVMVSLLHVIRVEPILEVPAPMKQAS